MPSVSINPGASNRLPAGWDTAGTAIVRPDGGRFGVLSQRLRAAFESARNNNPFDLGVMASPPTLTVNGTAPSPARSVNWWNSGTQSGAFRILGAIDRSVRNEAGAYGAPKGPRTAASTYGNSNPWCVEFFTDAPKLDINCVSASSSAYRLQVDGAYADATGTSNASNWRLTVDFPSRAMRRIRVEVQLAQQIGTVAMDASDTIYPGPVRPRVAVIGDSYITGTISPSSHPHNGVGAVMREVGGVDLVGLGIGSSGYAAGNAATNTWRLDDALTAAPELLVVALGINDTSGAALQTAITATLTGLRSRLPAVPVVVLGPWPANRNQSAAILAVELDIYTAVTALNDPMVKFIPTVTASATVFPWVDGTNDTNSSGGTDGNSEYMTGDDGTHPSAAGAEYLGRRAWQEILATVEANYW